MYSALVVASNDAPAAASVALGVAEALGGHRDVVIADLAGVPMLTELIDGGAEGVSDVFPFGVSFSRIAHRSRALPNLRVVPSGSDTVERPEIFRTGRWPRLAEGCRTRGELLLIVARWNSPGLEDLARRMEGAVAVGPVQSGVSVPFRILYRAERPVTGEWEPAPALQALKPLRWPLVAVGAAIVAAAIIAVGVRAVRDGEASRTTADDARAVTPAIPAATTATATANPTDSALAAQYAVELMQVNTEDGATFELQRHRDALPAATIAPVALGQRRVIWYKVIAGAYPEARQADSLLRAARMRRVLTESAGSLVQLPLALLVDSVPAGGGAARVVREHVSRGVPAYALLQADGRAFVYAGAFARAEESDVLAGQLRAGGLRPVLVYRIGRIF
jgi:hypothetical protein